MKLFVGWYNLPKSQISFLFFVILRDNNKDTYAGLKISFIFSTCTYYNNDGKFNHAITLNFKSRRSFNIHYKVILMISASKQVFHVELNN